MSDDTQRREAAARRTAKRNGWVIRKSRRRRTDAPDYGRYWVIVPDGNFVALPFGDAAALGATLDEVEEFLLEEDRSPTGYARRDVASAGEGTSDLPPLPPHLVTKVLPIVRELRRRRLDRDVEETPT